MHLFEVGNFSSFSMILIATINIQASDTYVHMCMSCECHVTIITLRTATAYKTVEPFWGEEYTLHIPTEFQTVSVYMYDQEAFLK